MIWISDISNISELRWLTVDLQASYTFVNIMQKSQTYQFIYVIFLFPETHFDKS